MPSEAWQGGHDIRSRFQRRVDPTTVSSSTRMITNGAVVPASLHVNAASDVFSGLGLALRHRTPLIEGGISHSRGRQSFRVTPLKRFDAKLVALHQDTVGFP